MIIDLKGLSEAGEDYKFDRNSEEFHGVLDDLVGKNNFEVQLRIDSLGNSYQVRGKLKSHYTDSCSRCGKDTDVPIQNNINEILMIEEVRPRTTQSTHGQQSVNFSEQSPSVTYIHSTQFNLAEFVHEMFAFSMQAYPKCLDQSQCVPIAGLEDKKGVGDKGHPAFSVLKKLKSEH